MDKKNTDGLILVLFVIIILLSIFIYKKQTEEIVFFHVVCPDQKIDQYSKKAELQKDGSFKFLDENLDKMVSFNNCTVIEQIYEIKHSSKETPKLELKMSKIHSCDENCKQEIEKKNKDDDFLTAIILMGS